MLLSDTVIQLTSRLGKAQSGKAEHYVRAIENGFMSAKVVLNSIWQVLDVVGRV